MGSINRPVPAEMQVLTNEELGLIVTDRLIHAIKSLRDRTGAGLKEARDVVIEARDAIIPFLTDIISASSFTKKDEVKEFTDNVRHKGILLSLGRTFSGYCAERLPDIIYANIGKVSNDSLVTMLSNYDDDFFSTMGIDVLKDLIGYLCYRKEIE